jgi:N-acyl homoserine lactone hydrolase
MRRNAIQVVLAVVATVLIAVHSADGGQGSSSPHHPQPPRSVRLYVFNCGALHNVDISRFNLKQEEVATTDMSVACFLIAHPKGTLVWDVGAVPDDAWKPTGKPTAEHVVLSDGQSREVIIEKTLRGQMKEIGYSPADITYLALSHYHYDHTANANAFAGSTWLVRPIERDTMFGGKPSGSIQLATISALEKSKTVLIKDDEYDVFGDRTVILKSAPGHTQGHQVLYVKLAKTGGVVLSGDLYHYPEEKALGRVPTFEFSQEETRASRVAVDAFLKKMDAQLWIQHDLNGNAKLKKSPQFYE